MHSDISYIRAYIVPITSTDHRHISTSNTNGNYPKILQRRQEFCSSARRSVGTATTYDQTLTFIEQLKRNQHRSVVDINRLPTQMSQDVGPISKTLTPQDLSYQLNLKLEYLIRTRVIDRHRVVHQPSSLPSTKLLKPATTTPRENLNRTTLSYLSRTREKNVVSSSTTTTNTTIVQDDSVEKDSMGDNDEAFEEMVEEEALTFLQQQP